MFKMLTLLALMLITVFSFLLIFAPESKLNIPVLKDIRKWIDKHKIIGPGLISVSYTHLDVYKRQMSYRSMRSFLWP